MLRSASTLAVRVGDKIGALKARKSESSGEFCSMQCWLSMASSFDVHCQGLAMRLREISQYLSQVVAGKLPMNQARSAYVVI